MATVRFPPLFLHTEGGFLQAATTFSEHVLTHVLSLYPFGQFLGSPVLGALSDRRGRRPILLGSLVWWPAAGPGPSRDASVSVV